MGVRTTTGSRHTCNRMSTGGGRGGPTAMQWEEAFTADAMVNGAPAAASNTHCWPVVPQPGGPGAEV